MSDASRPTAPPLLRLDREPLYRLSGELLCAVGFDGVLREANPAWEAALGRPPAQLRGRRLLELLDPDDAAAFADVLAAARGAPEARAARARLVRADGARVETAWRLAAVPERGEYHAAGRVVPSPGACCEASPDRRLVELGLAAAATAHDLNNVLTLVRGSSSLLKMRLNLPAGELRDLDDLDCAAEHGAKLLRDLMLGDQAGAPPEADLNTAIAGMGWLLRRLGGSRVAIDLSLAPEAGRVRARPVHLEQIVMNLVLNARDAMGGAGNLSVATSAVRLESPLEDARPSAPPGEYAVLTVADTGPGLPEAVRLRLFEPFVTTKAPGDGAGLGLYSVLRLVRRCGGHIRPRSRPEGGAVFEILLPRRVPGR